MRYSIEGQELTDIADALRRQWGETEWVLAEEPFETQTSSANGGTSFENLGGTVGNRFYQLIQIPEAKAIKVKIAYNFDGRENNPANQWLKIVKGNYYSTNYWQDKMPADSILITGVGEQELEFEGDTVTLYFNANNWHLTEQYGYYAECYGYKEVEVKRTYQTSEMAQAIDDIKVGVFLPDEAFVISGTCSYRFSHGGWDWFVESAKDKIITKDIRDAEYMFYNSTLEEIPFEINMVDVSSNAYHKIEWMFRNCSNLKSIPKINNCRPYNLNYLFYGCYCIRYVPDDIGDWFDWSYLENSTSTYTGNMSSIFQNCYSLRKIPVSFFNNGNRVLTGSYVYFNGGFNYCYSLDDVENMPIPYTSAFTSNVLSTTFNRCARVKNITFATPNGQPYVVNWKSQVMDLTTFTGWGSGINEITNYNSGILLSKEVKDDATYQALKNDPDWFTVKEGYSRYNHDSAVATINSLPDTSAYLATAGGTNTIKFKGEAGSLTDGGAINTLTADEIAVATAKGWTVTLA